MSLIHEVQTSLLDENSNIGMILLKLKVLAAKLEINILEEWIQYETGGYPKSVDIPDYRWAGIIYKGTFFNGYIKINDTSIPRLAIEKYADQSWLNFDIRDSLISIEDRLSKMGPDSYFGIDCADLKILLEGKIYPDMQILEITSHIDTGSYHKIGHIVRAKTLDFILKLEKEIPNIKEIKTGMESIQISPDNQKEINILIQNTIYGDVTTIDSNSTANSRINIKTIDNSNNESESPSI